MVNTLLSAFITAFICLVIVEFALNILTNVMKIFRTSVNPFPHKYGRMF